MKRNLRDLPAWTPFAPASVIPLSTDEITRRAVELVDRFSIPLDVAFAQIRDVENDVIALNSRYQVNMRLMSAPAPFGDVLHLSIKRLDKERVGRERYRDFMRIKDELVGPQFEAVEIYPARTDEIDTANQYHLWVLTNGFKLPFGWHGQRVVDGRSGIGGKQHPLD